MSHDRDRRRMLLAGVGAMGALAMARSARAATCGDSGPLGPTGPTMRQIYDKIAVTDEGLAEARTPIQSLSASPTALYRITQRGVYYLTDNILGVAGMSAIEIDADDVEIECDGFCFVGVPGTRQAIVATSPHHAIGVYDAGFVDWQETCIDLSSSTDCYVEEVWCRNCNCTSPTDLGAIAVGDGGTIDDSSVFQCASAHLRGGANSIFEENTIRDSPGSNIVSSGPAVVEDNFVVNSGAINVLDGGVVLYNRLVSSTGISVGNDAVVAENDLSSCSNGIRVLGAGCHVEENNVSNGPAGITVAPSALRAVIDGNNIVLCTGTGISVSAGTLSLIVRNTSNSAGGGSAYGLAAGNSWGTVVLAVGAGDLGALGITLDAWTNFEY